MAPSVAPRISLCCMRSLLGDAVPKPMQRRSLVTVHRESFQKLDLPPRISSQFWSQLPKRLKPDEAKRKIKIHQPPSSERAVCKDPVKIIDDRSLALLDPTGARTKLFDTENADRARPGDILLTTFKTGEPFSGIIMAVKGSGPHKSVLLRNHLTRVGTEMLIKVHSPLVQSMEIAQRGTKRRKRARLYYLRKPKHDVGSVQKIVDQYVRERALLSGRKSRVKTASGQRPSKTSRK